MPGFALTSANPPCPHFLCGSRGPDLVWGRTCDIRSNSNKPRNHSPTWLRLLLVFLLPLRRIQLQRRGWATDVLTNQTRKNSHDVCCSYQPALFAAQVRFDENHLCLPEIYARAPEAEDQLAQGRMPK